MHGKQTILVAGATGSIGGAAAALVKQGAGVILLGRKTDKLTARAERIKNKLDESGIEYKNEDIGILTVDFSSMESIIKSAGEPIADLILNQKNRNSLNGALYRLYKRVEKPDRAMNDQETGKWLWEELKKITGLKE